VGKSIPEKRFGKIADDRYAEAGTETIQRTHDIARTNSVPVAMRGYIISDWRKG
jgi:hypothetical protein